MRPIIPHGSPRHWHGVAIAFIAAAAAQAQTEVAFQVDMTAYGTPTRVAIAGSFNGWSTNANPLVNVTGNIWSNTAAITDPPGTVEQCKFVADGNYESIPNRQFQLGTGTQVLPLATWDVISWSIPTNQVTFQVNLSAQVFLGAFTNGDPNGFITVAGDFEGPWDGTAQGGLTAGQWDNGLVLTNNPLAGDTSSNIYSGTFAVVGFPGATIIQYKFRLNGGLESPASTGGTNRQAAITNTSQILPLVNYNDLSIYDLVQSHITVTFSLFITNGTLDDGDYAFQKGLDTIYLNGDFLGWWGWGLGSGPAADQMVEVGDTDVYTNSFVIPRGNSIYVNYKYSLDGFDDENGPQTNHIREIRSYGPAYGFPQDVWSWTVLQPGNGNPYPDPGITTTNIVEPDFGYLAIGAPSGGSLPITWLGRPGVVLQNDSSLTGGIWNTNNGTDAAMSTNWPDSGPAQYFRLMKKQ